MYKDPQGQNHWSYTVVPLVFAAIALLGAIYCYHVIVNRG